MLVHSLFVHTYLIYSIYQSKYTYVCTLNSVHMCNEVHYSCLILEVSSIERLFYLLNSMSIDTSTYVWSIHTHKMSGVRDFTIWGYSRKVLLYFSFKLVTWMPVHHFSVCIKAQVKVNGFILGCQNGSVKVMLLVYF